MTAPILLILFTTGGAPQARVEMHAPPGPDAFPNVRSVVWIPEARIPVGPVEATVRVPVFNTRFDCRGDRCSTVGNGNPALGVALRFELGVDQEPAPEPSGTARRPTTVARASRTPGWWTRLALRVHAPLTDPDLDGGRAARDVAILAPELWPELTPDALPVVMEVTTSRHLTSWFALEGELRLAGLFGIGDGPPGGGLVSSFRLDTSFHVAGRKPVALSLFGRGLLVGVALEPASAMFSPMVGGRLGVGPSPVPYVEIEAAVRFLAWHDDSRLPDRFVPGGMISFAVGFP